MKEKVNLNNLDDEFLSSVLDTQSWLRQSEQFYRAAQILVPKLKPERPITEDDNILAVGSLKAVLLLLAISVENALKAVKAMRGEIAISNGKIDRNRSFGEKGGHNLLGLAKGIGLPISSKEERLLEQLTEVTLWAGRYQQPLTIKAFGQVKEKNPRKLTIPHDIEDIGLILNKIHEIVHEHS